MPKTCVLNWYAKNRRLIAGLKKKLHTKELFDPFVTMRLGPKWANKLNPGDRVAISVSDNPEKPNIIGYAEVVRVSKYLIFFLDKHPEDLAKNIGAKSWSQVLLDMQSVYGPSVNLYSTISIIELLGIEDK